MSSNRRTLIVYSLFGLGFGLLATLSAFFIFDMYSESRMAHQAEVVLATTTYPAAMVARFCVPNPTISSFRIAFILALIAQWALLGFLIGVWRNWTRKVEGA